MKRILILALSVLAAVAAGSALADTPFPSVHAGDIFVIAHTTTKDCVMSDYFAPGGPVVFRAYAVDSKTRKVLTAKDVKYFYVKLPNGEPNVKLTYNPKAACASGQYNWTGTWNVPSTYPLGTVAFKMLVKSTAKRLGSFVQMPVVTSQLTISNTPDIPAGPGPTLPTAPTGEGRHRRLRRQRQRHAPRGRRSPAGRLHPDECVQAR